MYSVNGAQGSGGNPIYARQGRARQAWIDKFNTEARAAERKADERLAADAAGIVVGTAVAVATEPEIGPWKAGLVGGVVGDAVRYGLDKVIAISDHK